MEPSFDKRQHTRVACEIDSAFRGFGSGSGPGEETLIQDISEGGVRFRSSRFVSVHDRILLSLRIPYQKPIEVLVQPAWIREARSVERYDIGAKFLSLSEPDREIIRRFTQNF